MTTTTKSTHTPGPWTKNKYGDLKGSDGSSVLVWDSGIGHDSSHSVPESEANGRLIAAAPELLDSLRDMKALAEIKWGNLDPCANALFEKASKAIRKARGD